jgi:hypothetical protein
MITLPDGRRFFRYYSLPELKLPPLLTEKDFVIDAASESEAQLKIDDQTERHKNNETLDRFNKVYPCPTCAKVSLNADDLRVHMIRCNPSLFVVNGTEYSVQNVLIDESESIRKADSSSSLAPKHASGALLDNDDTVDTSDFINNHDLVHLPTVAVESDSDSSDESIAEEKVTLTKGSMFDSQFWWQPLIPSLDCQSSCHRIIDLLLLSFGFHPIYDDSNESEKCQIKILLCDDHGDDSNKEAELQEILISARIIDFCLICAHMGQISLGISMLWGILNSRETSYHLFLLQEASDTMKSASCSRSAYSLFDHQMHLMLISEFYRIRYCWLSRTNSKQKEEPCADELLKFLKDGDASTKFSSPRAPSDSLSPENSASYGWEHFVSCLQLQLEKHIIVPFSYKMTEKEQLAFLLECAHIGQSLQELVESIHDQSFSPLAHVLDPSWAVFQRVFQGSSPQQLDGRSCNNLLPQLPIILVICPIVFACASVVTSIQLASAGIKRSLVDQDSRKRLDLATLDKFIVDMIRELRRCARNSKQKIFESLLSPLNALSVAICVSLGLFDKVQLRLENAMNAKTKFAGREAPSLNMLSEMLMAQLLHLHMSCPTYEGSADISNIERADNLLQEGIVATHKEIASRIAKHGISLRGLDACGDPCFVSASFCNPNERIQWQDLVSIANEKYHANESRQIVQPGRTYDFAFDVSHPLIERNEPPTIVEFPRSLLVAGHALRHLSLVRCMLDELPFSIGGHLPGLLVSKTLCCITPLLTEGSKCRCFVICASAPVPQRIRKPTPANSIFHWLHDIVANTKCFT